jgi:hypothetical protein
MKIVDIKYTTQNVNGAEDGGLMNHPPPKTRPTEKLLQ